MALLSVQALGILYTAALFLICLVLVHAFYLARLGYLALRKKPDPPPPPKEETAKKPDTVYYIVEKKKKRAKAEYSEPKRIQFKDQSS